MTATTFAEHPNDPTPAASIASASAASSRQWRSAWRLHFYSGMCAMPFILLMALSGLVILYTGPIQQLTQGDLRSVSAESTMSSFDDQVAAVQEAYPEAATLDLTPPGSPTESTRVFIDDGSTDGRHVFVDPYTGEVLGETRPGEGLIGWSNRLHGSLNNDSLSISLPSVAALWDDDAMWRPYVVGDLVLELLAVWTLVLVFSGLFLWWPRRSSASTGSKGQRRLFGVRRNATGRARWRDLHGLGGVVLLVAMLVTVVSGLAWSTYWGAQFGSFADAVAPGSSVDAPASTLGQRGDLDRFGNQIPWNTGDFPIPASYAPEAGDAVPAPLRLNDVVEIAQDEGMKPGYTISFPTNEVSDAGDTVYGSFALYNSWPRKTGEARDLFVDQFSGETLAEQTVSDSGAVSRGMDTLISTHMGTQLGLFSRIMMTLLCVLSIWAVISGFVMFWKRRRPGTTGLPRRPVDVSLSKKLAVGGVALALVFPQWGVSALIILGVDRFVIRRVTPLRRAFGQA